MPASNRSADNSHFKKANPKYLCEGVGRRSFRIKFHRAIDIPTTSFAVEFISAENIPQPEFLRVPRFGLLEFGLAPLTGKSFLK